MIDILQPNYISKFNCIASKCEDTCCSGWRIIIDKETYNKYEKLSFPEEKDMLTTRLINAEINDIEEKYADVILQGNTCPFLTSEKLCRIQKTFGESYLSNICTNYPRNYNIVNGNLELSLNLSCPEAARIALLDNSSMYFIQENQKYATKIYDKLIAHKKISKEYPNNIFPYFNEVRSFTIELLQNRNYTFEERLIILGKFCKDLNPLSNISNNEGILQLLKEYTKHISNYGFIDLFNSVLDKPSYMLRTLATLIDYRIKTGVTSQRFLECFEQFKQGLYYTNEISDETLMQNYKTAKLNYFDKFINQYEYILENYFVNYIFKTLFPFCPEQSVIDKNIFLKAKDIFSEFMLLSIDYAMLKNLMIGISGYFKENMDKDITIKLIQSYSKNIGHNVQYRQQIIKFFEDNQFVNYAGALMLIKN